MSNAVQFDTPENVQLSYVVAGLGTRFLAYFIDTILSLLVAIVIWLALCMGGLMLDRLDWLAPDRPRSEAQATMYALGLATLINSLGKFFYSTLSEMLMRGQTIGKRNQGIRVVKADGFSIDVGSILVRNLFRIVDEIPLLWIVPVVSKSSRRLGDLVAGTVVVVDKPVRESEVRHELAAAPAANAMFRFDAAALERLRPTDIEAIETLLSRKHKLREHDRIDLVDRLIVPIAKRLQVEVPPLEHRLKFFEDLLAAEVRRQHRRLG